MITVTDLNQDEILRLLSDQYRRQTVRFLQRTPDGDVEFDQLCNHISQESGAEKDKIAIQLHHHHLPKLREQGLIDYEPTDQLVRYHADRQIEAVLDGIAVKKPPSISND